MNEILKYIENDKVGDAYKRALVEKNKNNITGFTAYAIVVSLNKLVSTAVRGKTKCKSSSEDIFNLADLCCKVEGICAQDRTGRMQCIYHLMRYLLCQAMPVLARKICEHFFHINKENGHREWSEMELQVLSNTHTYFVYYLCDVKNDILSFPDDSEIPSVSWFNFILSINELNNFLSTSNLFKTCNSLLWRAQKSSDHTYFIEVTKSLLDIFSNHLVKMVKQKTNWRPKEDSSSFFMSLLIDLISFLSANDVADSMASRLLKFNQSLKNLMSNYELKELSLINFEIIEITLNLCISKDEKTSKSFFDIFLEKIRSNDNISIYTYTFIHSCLSLFRSKLCKILYKDNERVESAVNALYTMYTKSKPKNSTVSRTKSCELLHAFIISMDILISSKVESKVFKQLYKIVRLYFKEFSILFSSAQNKKIIFESGVSYSINVIKAYKDAELYRETAGLSKDLMKYILPISEDCIPVDTFTTKLEHLLNFFVISFGKIQLSVEAQIALIAFAGVHPQYTELVFKFWAELKASSSDYNFQKDSTSYDIITTQKDVIEEKWSPCEIKSIDIDKFLLEEIKSYSKHRELQTGPVIAVYRAAVKFVKDKIMLAEILTAAVDSVAANAYTPALKNLFISLENIRGSLLKAKDQTENEKKLCRINCIIGNVLYQQIRCDIVQVRKKAEDEVDLMEVPAKQGVPVVEGEAWNIITPAYSCLKIEEQITLAQKMFECLNYWREALKYISIGHEDKITFSFRYMKGLAYVFRLYCYKLKEVDMWKLIYNLSQKVSNEKYKILAVAELLGLSVNVDQDWVRDAEEVLKSEKVIKKKSHIYYLFFINYAKNLYFNRKFKDASKLLSELDEAALKRHFLVYAQHKMVEFLLKKDKLELSPNGPRSKLYSLIKVFSNILFLVMNNKWTTFCEKSVLQWLLLEHSLTISKTFSDLRLVRHARCYSIKQLSVAQKLALPFRVCEFLVVLCNIDLQMGHKVDANEKLDGLDRILGLDHILVASNENYLENYFNCETTSVNDIKKPKFLSHDSICSCLMCANLEFLTITLNTFALKGVYTSSARDHSLAKHIFSIGEMIIETVNKKEEHLFSNLIYFYKESKVRFYLSLSFACAARGEVDKALAYNQAAQNELEPIKEYNSLLKQEALCQLTTLKCFLQEPPAAKTYKPKLYANDPLVMENVKTPEPVHPVKQVSKFLKSAVTTTKNKLVISPTACHARKILFDDIGNELEGKFEAQDKENSSPEVKTSRIDVDKSPLAHILSRSPKASAVKKILAFDDSSNTVGNKTPQALSEWLLETPNPDEKINIATRSILTRTRRTQTEKKVKTNLQKDLFATPFTKKMPEIKVFCDNEEESKSISRTVKSRTRKAATNTVKKRNVKKAIQEVKSVSGRKLTFDSDTEEEANLKKPMKRASTEKLNEVAPKQIGRRLFDSNDEKEATEQNNSAAGNSWQVDESTIIEPSFIEHREEKMLCLPLTPCTLEDSLKQLSLSGKKLLPLSTRKMARLKNLEQTPTSTLVKRASSRLNMRNREE